MGERGTRFTVKKRRNEGINRLIRDISNNSGIDPKIIKKHSNQAIKTWEKATKNKMVNLFNENPDTIRAVIPQMLTYFENEFEPVVNKQDLLDQTLEITRISLENMYRVT